MHTFIVLVIIAGIAGVVFLFVSKLKNIQNVKKNENVEEFAVILEDLGFRSEITQEGVTTRRHFNIEITNKGKQDTRWIRYEVVTTFHNVKIDKDYATCIVNGTSSTSSYKTKTETYRCYKHGWIHDNPIPKNSSVKESLWLSFSGENHDECTGIEAYQIFGEFDNGDKFHKILTGKIEFNNKDFVIFTYVDPV